MKKPKLPTIFEEPSDREHHRAAWWRKNVAKLTVQELADLTGYTSSAIYFMERGVNSEGRRVKEWVWRRYKMTCAGVEMQLRQGRAFDWEGA